MHQDSTDGVWLPADGHPWLTALSKHVTRRLHHELVARLSPMGPHKGEGLPRGWLLPCPATHGPQWHPVSPLLGAVPSGDPQASNQK